MSRTASIALFFLVVVAVVGGLHFYLWVRLVRDPALAEPWRRAATLFLAGAALALPAGIFGSRLLPRPASGIVWVVLFTWMGAAFLLFSVLLVADAVRLLAAAAEWLARLGRETGPPADPSRRVFLSRAVAGGAVMAAAGATAVAIRGATGSPRVNEVPVRLERLPRALSGLTIAQISDLHVGPSIGEREVRRVVEMTNALRPDLVAITGDLVDATVPQLRAATGQLAALRSRYGSFFVTGNHEYYAGVDPWLEELERYGIRVLSNERVAVGDPGPGGASIDLAGIDDWSHPAEPANGQGKTNLSRALGQLDPDRSLVLLAHQPRGVDEAVRAGVELQLSGHTHGGQIFPWNLVVGAFFPYVRGLYRHREGDREGQVYVSCGTGYWGPPLRLGAPAEIAKIVLTT